MSTTKRKNITPNMSVSVVQKQHQHNNQLTDGIVKDILTNSDFHPHGIKVRLKSGIVGRVKIINSN